MDGDFHFLFDQRTCEKNSSVKYNLITRSRMVSETRTFIEVYDSAFLLTHALKMRCQIEILHN